MKIDNRLPQFDKETALIAVTSEHAAKFYLARMGEIKELDIFHILNERLTDREGFLKKTVGKGRFGAGSAYEPKSGHVFVRFLHKFKKEIRDIYSIHRFDAIYLLSPQSVSKEIFSVLPAEFCDMVKFKITGNFVDASAYDLLRKIKEEIKKAMSIRKVLMTTEETHKLLEKSEI